jgi:hypothetical protein
MRNNNSLARSQKPERDHRIDVLQSWSASRYSHSLSCGYQRHPSGTLLSVCHLPQKTVLGGNDGRWEGGVSVVGVVTDGICFCCFVYRSCVVVGGTAVVVFFCRNGPPSFGECAADDAARWWRCLLLSWCAASSAFACSFNTAPLTLSRHNRRCGKMVGWATAIERQPSHATNRQHLLIIGNVVLERSMVFHVKLRNGRQC